VAGAAGTGAWLTAAAAPLAILMAALPGIMVGCRCRLRLRLYMIKNMIKKYEVITLCQSTSSLQCQDLLYESLWHSD
jgi:hypothetical protein